MRNLICRVSPFCLLSLLLIGFSGCGGDASTDSQDDFASLQPDLQALNARLDTHYDSVAAILGSPVSASTASEAADLAASLTEDDWAAVRKDTDEYGQEMHRILNDLGDKVTMVGACQMMIGGMMIGPHDGDSCSCQPYMDSSADELQDHLSLMLSWMGQHNQEGLWGEMGRHMEQMGSRIQSMANHMREIYRADGDHHGGMM